MGFKVLCGFIWLLFVTCVFSMPQPEEKEVAIQNDEPTFLSRPINVTVKKGQTVRLPCQVDDLASFAFLWWHEQKVLFANAVKLADNSRLSLNKHDLTIKDVQDEDTGLYYCYISTAEPMRLEHHVFVERAPEVKAVEPDVIKPKGSPATLACEIVKGVPEPKITWRKDGQPMNWVGPDVTMQAVDQNNAGKYTCIGTNGVGQPSTANIQLSVLFPPEIKVQEEWIHSGEGYQAEIACIISGEPRPQVEWYRGNQKLNVKGSLGQYKVTTNGRSYTLQIDQLREQDFGFYSCRARNEQGQSYKQIELSGIAKHVNFTSPPNGDSSDSYDIEWEVESYSPILEYAFKYRLANFNESVATPGQWVEMLVKPDKGSSNQRFKHRKSLTLPKLRPKTQYEAMVKAKNKFGWNADSDTFRFATLGATVPTSAPISGSIKSVVLPVIVLPLTVVLARFF